MNIKICKHSIIIIEQKYGYRELEIRFFIDIMLEMFKNHDW